MAWSWAGVALAASLGGEGTAQEIRPGRFDMQVDVTGGIWVVDAGAGLVSRCREGDPLRPRVVDIDFGVPVARPRGDGAGEPVCTDWRPVAGASAIQPKVIDAGFDAAGGTFSGQ